MNDRVSESFESMMSQMEEPPTWDEVSAQTLRVTRSVLLTGPWIAVVAGLATVLVVGAVAFLLQGGDPIGSSSIPYVRLAWSQEVEMRCIGMDTVDNGGFDSAVIEIWGPNQEEFYRIDVTAPDGTVERLLVDATDFPEDSRWWSTPEHWDFGNGFRNSECSTSVGNQSSSYSVSQPPVIHGLFPVEFTELFAEWYDAEQGEIEARLNDRFDRIRDDTWRGSTVVVYAEPHTYTDEFGLTRSSEERWVDLAAERVERLVTEFDTELIARSAVTIEVVERAEVAADTVSFSTEGMFPGPGNDIPPTDDESDGVTTTSISPTAHPIMANAVELDVEDIPTEALVKVIDPGPADSFFAIPVSEFQLLVRLRPGVPAHLYATSCDVLIQVGLPEGWEGTCLERTVNGELKLGVFQYGAVSE
jgi:hypothetical protein